MLTDFSGKDIKGFIFLRGLSIKVFFIGVTDKVRYDLNEVKVFMRSNIT